MVGEECPSVESYVVSLCHKLKGKGVGLDADFRGHFKEDDEII
jgi:hypothetical protein